MDSSIGSRFSGEGSERRLVDALALQAIVGGDRTLASALAQVSKIETYEAGAAIVQQGDADTDFYLILVGSVQIERNTRPGPIRHAGEHFGEMSLIDVRSRRSATVRSREPSAVARIAENDFASIATRHPDLWRRLAIEIASRLRQRLEDVPPRNARPYVFIGSSKEGLHVAEAIRLGISDDGVDVRVWTDGVFGASATAIESLEHSIRGSDVAVLVLSPDDKLRTRGTLRSVPRDNVIFELGLFMGALGRTRVFIVRPGARSGGAAVGPVAWLRRLLGHSQSDLKIPSDLLGVTPLSYEPSRHSDRDDRLAPACAQIRGAITRLGAK